MIHMPHRSVTRYFIPMIDVLLLLFCIFLLMPIASEDELIEQRDAAKDLGESVKSVENEVRRQADELKNFEQDLPALRDMAKIKKELEDLREANRQSLQQRAYFQIIDIDPKGKISYFDPIAADADKARIKLESDKAVKDLIKRHKEEAGGKREVYYYFLYPRPPTGYPTVGQERLYKLWFGKVANSLREIQP